MRQYASTCVNVRQHALICNNMRCYVFFFALDCFSIQKLIQFNKIAIFCLLYMPIKKYNNNNNNGTNNNCNIILQQYYIIHQFRLIN